VNFLEIEGAVPGGNVFISIAAIARLERVPPDQRTTTLVLVDGTTYPVAHDLADVLQAISLAETSTTPVKLISVTEAGLTQRREKEAADEAEQAARSAASAQRQQRDRCPSPRNGHRHLWKHGEHPRQCALCQMIEDPADDET
jgi:hypothetical protein